MTLAILENAAMRVSVRPDYGARIVSLIDKAGEREWIAQGAQSTMTGEDAIYAAAEAVGWDECFPTVAPCEAGATFWGRRLRDHGDLWGRAWVVDAQSPQDLATSYTTPEYKFSRRLSLISAVLNVDYRLENKTYSRMPYLWALHALLAPMPGETIVLPGVKLLTSTYINCQGKLWNQSALDWPGTKPTLGFQLSDVQSEFAGFAGKFYTEECMGSASIGRDQRWLVINWGAPIVALGLWANYGGWPEPPCSHHLALEPTTAPADHLAQALEQGKAAWLAPGDVAEWHVSLSLASSAEGLI